MNWVFQKFSQKRLDDFQVQNIFKWSILSTLQVGRGCVPDESKRKKELVYGVWKCGVGVLKQNPMEDQVRPWTKTKKPQPEHTQRCINAITSNSARATFQGALRECSGCTDIKKGEGVTCLLSTAQKLWARMHVKMDLALKLSEVQLLFR